MKQQKFKTAYNALDHHKGYEKIEGASLTVPNMALSIAQLVRKGNVSLDTTMFYEGENDDPLEGVNWHKLDLSEKHEVMQQGLANIKRIQKARQEAVDAKNREDLQKQEKDKIEKQYLDYEETKKLGRGSRARAAAEGEEETQ